MFNIAEILAKAQLLIDTIKLLNATVGQLHASNQSLLEATNRNTEVVAQQTDSVNKVA